MSFKKILPCLVIIVLVQSALTSTVAEKATKALSSELSKLLWIPNNTTTTPVSQTIRNIQAIVDSVFANVNALVTSGNINNIVSVLQTNIVTPLLNLLNNLASQTFIQTVPAVYAVVLILQTVLTIANSALGTARVVVSGTIAAVQGIVDSVFGAILNIVNGL